MENKNQIICIYDDTKEDINNLLLNIYLDFAERELQNITNIGEYYRNSRFRNLAATRVSPSSRIL